VLVLCAFLRRRSLFIAAGDPDRQHLHMAPARPSALHLHPPCTYCRAGAGVPTHDATYHADPETTGCGAGGSGGGRRWPPPAPAHSGRQERHWRVGTGHGGRTASVGGTLTSRGCALRRDSRVRACVTQKARHAGAPRRVCWAHDRRGTRCFGARCEGWADRPYVQTA
jgi:hypothetical protein